MSDSGYIQILHDLLRHPSVVSAPPAYRWVLMTIIDYACYAPCQQDDHGVLIDLLPGQFVCSFRKLAELANVGRKDVEHAIARFSQIEILGHEVRHTKSIFTILWGMKFKSTGTRSGTTVGQLRDIKEENNTDSSVEEPVCLFVNEKKIKEEMDDSPLLVAKSKKHSSGVTSIRINTLTKQLLEEDFSQEEINQAIGILKNSDPNLNSPIKNYLIGIMKNQRKMQLIKKENKKCKPQRTQEKLTPISKNSSRTDNVFYSAKDTSESPLAIYARQNGLK